MTYARTTSTIRRSALLHRPASAAIRAIRSSAIHLRRQPSASPHRRRKSPRIRLSTSRERAAGRHSRDCERTYAQSGRADPATAVETRRTTLFVKLGSITARRNSSMPRVPVRHTRHMRPARVRASSVRIRGVRDVDQPATGVTDEIAGIAAREQPRDRDRADQLLSAIALQHEGRAAQHEVRARDVDEPVRAISCVSAPLRARNPRPCAPCPLRTRARRSAASRRPGGCSSNHGTRRETSCAAAEPDQPATSHQYASAIARGRAWVQGKRLLPVRTIMETPSVESPDPARCAVSHLARVEPLQSRSAASSSA